MEKVTAVFDIGKTNKKFCLFDKNLREVYTDYISFNEIKDEDGFPCEDLEALREWAVKIINKILRSKKYNVVSLNFSTYGASLVHIDIEGNPLTPLYNYLKPLPAKVLKEFYAAHGGKEKLMRETSSPASGMLNSGIQLYWIKKTKPAIFKKIKFSLHLPQYISYLFTGLPLSDYTSIGCHTMLWNYKKHDYHKWVYKEKLDRILAPIVNSHTSININYQGQRIEVGVGIHDSSAALIPYLRGVKQNFLLVSTGTWNISLNPFSNATLTTEQLDNDCLNYMTPEGVSIFASRIFLGAEYKYQILKLCKYYNKTKGYHKTISYDEKTYTSVINERLPYFRFKYLSSRKKQTKIQGWEQLGNFKRAYFRLMYELLELQLESSKLAMGNSSIEKIYIDGGFIDNDVFVKLVSYHFKDLKLRTSSSPKGSAIGAAMVLSENRITKKFFRKQYRVKKHKALKVRFSQNDNMAIRE